MINVTLEYEISSISLQYYNVRELSARFKVFPERFVRGARTKRSGQIVAWTNRRTDIASHGQNVAAINAQSDENIAQ